MSKSSTLSGKRSDLVVEFLRQKLAMPEHGPGYKLLPERQLAMQLKVSRRVVREALEQLAREGIIERVPGRGTIVVERKQKVSLDDSIVQQLNPLELMTTRLVLEPAICEAAALNASTLDILALQGFQKQGAEARSYIEWEEADKSFHESLAAATNNALLQHFSLLLSKARRHTEWGRLRQPALSNETRQQYSQHHLRIIEAIRNRSPKDACEKMREHLEAVRMALLMRH